MSILRINKIPIIEGFFIETLERLIFDVKGLVHPPDRVIAYVRYVPNSKGDRISKRGFRYSKIYSLQNREEFLKAKYPYYIYYDPIFGRRLQGVPKNRIRHVYNPLDKLRELRETEHMSPVEREVVELAEEIAERAGVRRSAIGVTGSVLVGLYTPTSDIDLVVYGENEGKCVYSALLDMIREGSKIRYYSKEELKRLFSFRVKDTLIPLDIFLKIEKNKVLQGIFKKREYFIRLVKRPEEFKERYGDRRYRPLGRVRLRALVTDARDSIFTPCKYIVDNVRVISGSSPEPIREIVSYRGRFREQAKEGDVVIAEGALERVENDEIFYRVLIGENPQDILIPHSN